MTAARERDYRVDFWRGFALLTIFVNHVPGNVFENLTTRNFGFSDAAELFVLLAGYAAALAYFRGFEAGAPLVSSAKALWRAATLYVAHLATVLLAIAVFAAGAILTQHPKYLEAHGLGQMFTDPVTGVIGLVTLGFQIGYFNILPMYMVFLLLLPLLMWLAARDLWMALAASAGLWMLVQITGVTIPNWPGEGGWFFNPFAWQFLFTIGFVVSVLVMRGGGVPYSRPLFWGAAAYLAVSFLWVVTGFAFDPQASPLPEFLVGFSKADLSLNRLLHVLALAYLVAHLPVSQWLRGWLTAGNPLVVLGRHSLIVFCVGSLLAATGQVTLFAWDGGLVAQLVVVGTGIALHFALGAMLEWYRVHTARPAIAAKPAASEAPAARPAAQGAGGSSGPA